MICSTWDGFIGIWPLHYLTHICNAKKALPSKAVLFTHQHQSSLASMCLLFSLPSLSTLNHKLSFYYSVFPKPIDNPLFLVHISFPSQLSPTLCSTLPADFSYSASPLQNPGECVWVQHTSQSRVPKGKKWRWQTGQQQQQALSAPLCDIAELQGVGYWKQCIPLQKHRFWAAMDQLLACKNKLAFWFPRAGWPKRDLAVCLCWICILYESDRECTPGEKWALCGRGCQAKSFIIILIVEGTGTTMKQWLDQNPNSYLVYISNF